VYDRLTKFPYFSNYVDLTQLELGAIYAVDTTPIRKIAFIGSGPLPLTSLQLIATLSSDIEILNIDHDLLAIERSKNTCSRLGIRGKGMEFLCAEAGSCDLAEFDVVYLAALVGSTQKEKEELLIKTVARMSEGAILVVRSAHGMRRVLYAVRCMALCVGNSALTWHRSSTLHPSQ
jgi:Nicotianamine synthase protein